MGVLKVKVDGVWVPVSATGPAGPEGPPGPSGQSAGRIFYYAPSDASDIATYKTMRPSPSAGGEQTIATVCTGSTEVLVAAFATDPGVPGVVDYPAGTAYRRIYAMVSAGSARLRLQVYVRNGAGTETIVRDEYSEAFADTTVTQQEWTVAAPGGGAMTATDRIVNKIYAQRLSGPTNVTVTTYYEGTSHASQIQTTISAGAQGPPGVGVPTGGTTGQVLAKASNTDYDTAWTTAAGGSGGASAYAPFTAPSLAGFAWVNQGTATATETGSRILLAAPAVSGDTMRILKLAAPAAPYTLTAALLPNMVEENYQSTGILLRESATGKLATLSCGWTDRPTLRVYRWNSPTSWGGAVYALNSPQLSVMWFRISRSGSTLSYFFSVDGYHWRSVYTEAMTVPFTTAPDELGVWVNSGHATYPAALSLVSWAVT